MPGDVIRPPQFGDTNGGGGDGTMQEQRVAALEADMKEVKASLKAIELAVAEIKHLPKMSDFLALQKDIGDVRGKLGAVEGRIQGLERRFAQIPNTQQLIGILFSVAAVLFAASRVFR
jgi:hypothetical protein